MMDLQVATDLGHWRHVGNYVSKGEQTEFTAEFAAKIRAAAGIVALEEGQYKLAARK